jgi:hypothetical protein
MVGAARSIPFGTLTSSVTSFQVGNGPLRMLGFGIKNTSTSATAEVDFYDGEGSGGQLICQVTLAANESAREWWAAGGVDIEHGLCVVWVSGSVSGSAWIRYPLGEVVGELEGPG